MLEKYAGEQIANVPNFITSARIAGSLYESLRYAQTGEVRHYIAAGTFFCADVLDGPAARMLDQTTQFGADLDPIGDKLTFIAMGAAALKQGTLDRPVAIAVGTVNVSNMLATVVGKGRDMEVTKSGKKSQLLMNLGVGSNVLGNHWRNNEDSLAKRSAGNILRLVGGGLAITSASTLGAKASVHYWKSALAR